MILNTSVLFLLVLWQFLEIHFVPTLKQQSNFYVLTQCCVYSQALEGQLQWRCSRRRGASVYPSLLDCQWMIESSHGVLECLWRDMHFASKFEGGYSSAMQFDG